MGLPWPCGIAVAPALSLEPCVLSLPLGTLKRGCSGCGFGSRTEETVLEGWRRWRVPCTESAASPHEASPAPGHPYGTFGVQGRAVLASCLGRELCLPVVNSVTPGPVARPCPLRRSLL